MKLILSAAFCGILALWMFSIDDDPKPTELERISNEIAQLTDKGFHCLDPLSGAHLNFNKTIMDRVNASNLSFEHVKTTVFDIDEDGRHKIIVDYRLSRSSGKISGVASGYYSNSNCYRYEIVSITQT